MSLRELSGAAWSPKDRRSNNLLLNCARANSALTVKRGQWAGLDLRQQWSDETFMREHLRMAGIRIKYSQEPATVRRLKTLLRRVGIASPVIQESIGMSLSKFLTVNPRLPLWAALALVLESTGMFTPTNDGAV